MSYAQVKRQEGKVGNLIGMLRRSGDTVERSVLADRVRKASVVLDDLRKGYIQAELAKILAPYAGAEVSPEAKAEMVVVVSRGVGGGGG